MRRMRRPGLHATLRGAAGLGLVLRTACGASAGEATHESVAPLDQRNLAASNQATAEVFLSRSPAPAPTATPSPLLPTPTPEARPRVVAQREITIEEAHGWLPTPGFTPNDITEPVGSWVTWSNAGAAAHHVLATTGAFDSGELEPSEGFSWYADRPGTIVYTCLLLEARRAEVRARIRELQRLEKDLAQLAERGSHIDPADCDPFGICKVIPIDRTLSHSGTA